MTGRERAPKTERVVLRCVECGASWEPSGDVPWRIYVLPSGDSPTTACYCGDCAEREFGR